MLIVSATCHFCWQNGSPTIILYRDTDYLAEKCVSLHETRLDDRNTASDTQFHAEKGVSLQGKVVGKERRLVNLGCREADLARDEDRRKQRAEVNRHEPSCDFYKKTLHKRSLVRLFLLILNY